MVLLSEAHTLRVLLIHPKDSPRNGPWVRKNWDLLVDLGRSSESRARCWQELLGCSVLRLESFRRCIEDARLVGTILRQGRSHLLDEQGLDWWELTSLFIYAELEKAILIRRLAADSSLNGDIFSTRDDWMVRALAQLLRKPVSILGSTSRSGNRVERYWRAFGRLSLPQIAEIFFDKYDGGYRWRGRLALKRRKASEPVVLLPSPYTNVSRLAAAYARTLPEQAFLLVATRRGGMQFEPPANITVARLAKYAVTSASGSDCAMLVQKWQDLRPRLKEIPEIRVLGQTGILDSFTTWLRNGLPVRDAWHRVLDQEPVISVLCGDDSNWYTRLPIVLARKRGLPTVGFHHGAFDGLFLMKDLASETYLAKNEMEQDYLVRVCNIPDEKIVIGAPNQGSGFPQTAGREAVDIVFFSEPYESTGGRWEEIYRELLVPLCELAVKCARQVVVKLHPFENARERSALLDKILSPEKSRLVKIVSGPLTDELLSRAWFGITVQSTTVADCAERGVPCFLCSWVTDSPYGYIEQFSRFGMGIILKSAAEIAEIPDMLAKGVPVSSRALAQPIAAETLRRLLSSPASRAKRHSLDPQIAARS